MNTEQSLIFADQEIDRIVGECSTTARNRCVAQMARGEKADYDATLEAEFKKRGMPALGSAVYQKHRPIPTRREIDLQFRSQAAREECEAIRARGGKPDTDEIFKRHCG
jgi:hypothetical protein